MEIIWQILPSLVEASTTAPQKILCIAWSSKSMTMSKKCHRNSFRPKLISCEAYPSSNSQKTLKIKNSQWNKITFPKNQWNTIMPKKLFYAVQIWYIKHTFFNLVKLPSHFFLIKNICQVRLSGMEASTTVRKKDSLLSRCTV